MAARLDAGELMAGQSPAPSLEIGFGDGVTRARLRAGTGYEADLRRLALRFQSSVQRSPGTLEVEIDDLLTNLVSLATWPEPSSVSWDPQLASLATDSAVDAQTVAKRLDPTAALMEKSILKRSVASSVSTG